MRILHINCNYMTTSLHQTMIEHLNIHTENMVFCPIRKNQSTTTIPNSNVTVCECFSSFDRIFFFKKQSQIMSQVEKHFSVNSFDLLHAYTLFTDGNCAYNLNKKYGVPYVVAVRDTDMNVFFRLKPYLIGRAINIMRNASYIFFLSEAYKNRMIENYIPVKDRELFVQKMLVIPNGIDDFWLDNVYMNRDAVKTEQNILEKKVNIVCVGRIIGRKNIPILQKAIQLLCDEGWAIHLDVIGKGVDKKELDRIQNDDHTTYYEPMKKEQLIERYRHNDIFVLASRTETFGLVYAEAISQGLPIVYTKGQGFDGQFAEGTVGYHCDCDSASDIKDQIVRVCEKYGKLSKQCVDGCQRYRWSLIVDKYKDIYDTIVNR